MENKRCPKCKKGTMKYYHGMLGYESFQCNRCHYDINESKPIKKIRIKI